MKLTSKLLKRGYGLDQEGAVFDQPQENIDDKNNPRRNPDKKDWVPQNSIVDETSSEAELKAIEEHELMLNPPNRESVQ
jgi:hypothetical protein